MSKPPTNENGDAQCARLCTRCTAAIKDWCKGQRVKAKKTLQRLANENPTSWVPARFMARLLYHEAAVLEGQQSGGKARLQLLQEALACASIGTQLNPNSLSTAALRATLCVNMLVELSGSAAGAIPDALSIKEEFKGAILACQIAASTPEPTLSEPVIAINDGSQTCDPCSLRVQDQVLQWVKEGRWDRVVQEKRNVLVCMQQVLHSCYTLLDSSQIPVDGVVRLLQHILRVRPFNTMPCRTLLPQKPVQQQDLQVWAGQLLG
ncbi:hypothetical protein V8C86DRAFT_2860957, partial [Haematococcus lacustris]